MSTETRHQASHPPEARNSDQPLAPLYRAVWRWHFFAGIVVLPFLFVLSVSGLLMLISKPLEPLLLNELTTVTATEPALPASALLATVEAAHPHQQVKLYLPPSSPTESARFVLVAHGGAGHGGHGAPATTVFINPYSGEILGSHDPASTFYAQVKTLHGSLMLGNLGDTLIEVVAGLAVLMVITGLYLAIRGKRRQTSAQTAFAQRENWRQAHRWTGVAVALPLLFFLLSGMAWTNVWGGKMVQGWSALPGTRLDAALAARDLRSSEPPPSTEQHQHSAMNESGVHQVPWVLEQTPMPSPTSGTPHAPGLDLDAVNAIATAEGLETFRVHLPQDANGVWTVSATTIAGDITNPLNERVLHLDPHNGQLIAELTFADYPWLGKAMAAFIPTHQGDLGLWNWLLNLLLVLAIIALMIASVVMWWKRRPARAYQLAPPAATPAQSRGVIAVMLVLAVCFPLSGAAMVVVILVDTLLISRVPTLRALLK
ncbi:PepSY domain-containing protein [Spongiibacter taiwanensis]|uniref:PepSY-associated TM helix domain-containing protein n=1 Tax=Spongiibacter taiwanensis TaxID=1748242 RepID=UPI002034E519|nr:PepSY domain-containing protein [Spongiibacter taiwanensis]USA44360.1 PepSY domain-containing protein [Spongiibacter taiwanensis]